MKNKTNKALIATGLMTIGAAAHAELPAAVGTAFAQLQTDGVALIEQIFPVMIAITIGFTVLRLLKKGLGKAV